MIKDWLTATLYKLWRFVMRDIDYRFMQTFLSAEWRKLAMANYAVDPVVLQPYLPYRTELDLWRDTCYVSLVGFMFLETAVKGFKIPFHVNFEEVNLRFYVRYKDGGVWKRGVVFIKEIVPKAAITWVANTIYKENYETLPMEHTWEAGSGALNVAYRWRKNKSWNSLQVMTDHEPVEIQPGSEEEFITEHYWGYAKIGDRKTSEYEVVHPRWQVYPVRQYAIDVDFGKVYGDDFGFLKSEIPRSVFLAEGSEIQVLAGNVIR
jgi:uncharacterized protein YqjF (DUF2071 family)